MQDACRLHYDGMQEVAGCSTCMQEAAGCRSMHAACMQVVCSLQYASNVAASIEIHVHILGVDAVCRASTPCIRGSTPCTPASTPCMQAACRASTPRKYTDNEHAHKCQCHTATSCIRSYAGCMKPAWSLHAGCNLLHAACCNLQPPAYDRIHKERDNRHSSLSIPTCRASTSARRRRRPSNQSEFYNIASFGLCTFDFLVTFTTVEQLFTSVNSTDIATLNFLSQSRQANCFSLNWILWLDINNIMGWWHCQRFAPQRKSASYFHIDL